MSNLKTAPPFTSANAKEMQRRAQESIKQKKAAVIAAAALALIKTSATDTDLRKARVYKLVDKMLGDAEQASTAAARCKIVPDLVSLWKLVEPTAGQLKPRQSRSGRGLPQGNPEPLYPNSIQTLPQQ